MATSSRSKAAAAQRLMLTTTSLRNLVVSNKSDVIYYEIVTPRWARDRTTVSRLDPNTRQFDIVGEVRNTTDGKPAEVGLYGAATTPASRFLDGSLEPDTAGMK
jgi:hypothetical protein